MTHSSAARCAQLGIVISPQSRPAAWIQRLAEDADELTRVLADCLGVRASNKGKKLHSSCGGALSLALLARILLLVLEIVTAACPRDRHGRLCRCHAACNPPRHDRPSQWKCIAYPVRSIACALQCLDRSASSAGTCLLGITACITAPVAARPNFTARLWNSGNRCAGAYGIELICGSAPN